MESKYENLEKLNQLFKDGAISEEEYKREKDKILNRKEVFNVTNDEKQYSMLMQLSQFADLILPSAGFFVPLIMWLSRKENTFVDLNGKIIFNWKISAFIYTIIGVLIVVFSGIQLIPITERTNNPLPAVTWAIGIFIVPMIIFSVLGLVFKIIGAIKANNGEVWNYPLSIRFFKTN